LWQLAVLCFSTFANQVLSGRRNGLGTGHWARPLSVFPGPARAQDSHRQLCCREPLLIGSTPGTACTGPTAVRDALAAGSVLRPVLCCADDALSCGQLYAHDLSHACGRREVGGVECGRAALSPVPPPHVARHHSLEGALACDPPESQINVYRDVARRTRELPWR
jgi:hypothetical protein